MRMASVKDYKQKSSRVWFWKCCSGSSVENHLEEDKRRGRTPLRKRYQHERRGSVAQSCLTLCEPWTVTHQAPPLSIGFSRQEYWSGLSSPSPGIFPNQGSNSGFLHCRQTLYCLGLLAERQWCDDNCIIHTFHKLRWSEHFADSKRDSVAGERQGRGENWQNSCFSFSLGSQEQVKS